MIEEHLYQGYKIKPQGTYPFKVITARGSGGIPVSLGGQYTTVPQAKRAIDLYLSTLVGKKKKVSKNVENHNTS